MESLIQTVEEGVAIINEGENNIVDNTKKDIFSILSLELNIIRNEIVTLSKEYEGHKATKYSTPEKGVSEEGFDCSGFVTFILSKFGLSKKGIRHSNEYFDNYGIFVHKPILGDLIFFSNNGNIPTHMGIYIGNNKYINKNGDTIKIDNIKNAHIKGSNEKSLYTSNPIGFKRINLEIKNFSKDRWKQVI